MEFFTDPETGLVVPLGLVPGLTNDEYHAAIGYSSSQVRKFGERSPKHFWWDTIGQAEQAAADADGDDEDEKEDEEAKELTFGTAFHAAVLEPDLFANSYLVSMPFNARTKSGRAYRDEFAAQCRAENKIALHPDDNKALLGMRDAVFRHPIASGLLIGGQPEQSYFTLDKELGVVRKCRPDYLLDNGFAMIDLKSTKSTDPVLFFTDGTRKGYDLAVPWYLDILQDLYGEAPKNFAWVAVEKKPPYAIGVFWAHPDDIAESRRLVRHDFARLVECKRTNHWPDWGEEPQRFQRARWGRRAP